MGSCCHGKQTELESTAQNHRRVLWTVLIINLIMFIAEVSFGIIYDSVALLGDSLDMLGDTITYGSSIAVLGLPLAQKAKVARLKAWIMLISGLAVSGKCFYQAFNQTVPESAVIAVMAAVALSANLICLYLLTSHKEDDINMRSVWICSRNDIIANISLIIAAGAVYAFNSAIPDLIVGMALAALFLKSALTIFKDVKISTGQITS